MTVEVTKSGYLLYVTVEAQAANVDPAWTLLMKNNPKIGFTGTNYFYAAWVEAGTHVKLDSSAVLFTNAFVAA